VHQRVAASRLDIATSDRPHRRVRTGTVAGVGTHAGAPGATFGPVAHTEAACAPVTLTPAGGGAARPGATGTSTGRAAGGTPSPVAGRSPSLAR
jgi:hypothetical protein